MTEMNNTYNEKTHTSIKQLFNKFSVKAPGFAYIASFDSGVTYELLLYEVQLLSFLLEISEKLP